MEKLKKKIKIFLYQVPKETSDCSKISSKQSIQLFYMKCILFTVLFYMLFYSFITVFINKVSKDKSLGKASRGKNILLELERLSPKL